MRGSAAFRASIAPGGVLAGPWVRNELWRHAKAVPSLDLRFAENKSLVDATTGASLVTFTRASSATYVDSQGVIQTAVTDVARFDHNPTTGESLGLLVEEQRSNLLLNSATLSTQNVTVTAVAHTLSFAGTGTITLTGTSIAGPLVGTGTGESNRVSLTFTPTAGVLTLTVSGTISNAQLELGSFRTSYIPTTSATVTRSADVASISGSNFSGWYRQDEGTVFADFTSKSSTSAVFSVEQDDISASNSILIAHISAVPSFRVRGPSSTTQAQFNMASYTLNQNIKSAGRYALDSFGAAFNGSGFTDDTSGTPPSSQNNLKIGRNASAATELNGTMKRFTYWPTRLPSSTLQTITR